MDQYRAGLWKTRVEDLLACHKTGEAMDPDTRLWVSRLPDEKHRQLVHYGLVEPRREKARTTDTGPTLKEWLDRYTTSQTVKPNTQLVYGRTVKHLVAFFGDDKSLAEISKLDAQDWRKYLVKYGLAANTIARTCGIARQFFKAAVDNELTAKNSFAVLKGQVRGNKDREYFLSRQDAEKILEACPDAQWRLIFALARFEGLRCPSEILGLRWQDVLWDKGRMLVHSPKTEHHEGGESRYVPIFPELAPLLHQALDLAEPGAVYVITRYRKAVASGDIVQLDNALHQLRKAHRKLEVESQVIGADQVSEPPSSATNSRTPRGMPSKEANIEVRRLLKEKPSWAWTVRSLAGNVGCSTGTICECAAWKAYKGEKRPAQA